MITPDQSFDSLRGKIGRLLAQWRHDLVPADVELLPNCPYAPRYAWMFAFEKRLKYSIEGVLSRPFGPELERLLFGPDGVVSEGLSNAFAHGHRRNPHLAITVDCAVGTAGAAFSIQDQGAGFDVESTLQAALGGRPYAAIAGNGIRSLLESAGVSASFGDAGRRLDLFVDWPWPRE